MIARSVAVVEAFFTSIFPPTVWGELQSLRRFGLVEGVERGGVGDNETCTRLGYIKPNPDRLRLPEAPPQARIPQLFRCVGVGMCGHVGAWISGVASEWEAMAAPSLAESSMMCSRHTPSAAACLEQ